MIEKVKSMKASARAFLFPALVGAATAGSSVVAFAAETGSPTLDLPQINIATEMLTPLVEGIVANVNVILPVGLGIMGMMLGIRLVPKLIRRFTGG